MLQQHMHVGNLTRNLIELLLNGGHPSWGRVEVEISARHDGKGWPLHALPLIPKAYYSCHSVCRLRELLAKGKVKTTEAGDSAAAEAAAIEALIQESLAAGDDNDDDDDEEDMKAEGLSRESTPESNPQEDDDSGKSAIDS